MAISHLDQYYNGEDLAAVVSPHEYEELSVIEPFTF